MANKTSVNSKIYIVSGKGGVGKSTVAAALGHSFAQQGFRTLVIELGENSYFDLVYDHPFGFKPMPVAPNLEFSIWSGEACLREFIAHYIRISAVVNLFFENKIMKTLVKAAPALQELSLVGKLTSGPRKIGPSMPYDRIVLDAYSSGHFLSLLRVPRAMAETISLGPMGQQSQSIHNTLINKELCQLVWVTTAEELPIQESLEFNKIIKDEFSMEGTLVLNKTISKYVNVELSGLNSSFAQYLKGLTEKELKAESKLVENKQNFSRAPFCLESDPQKRILELARVFLNHEVIN